MSIKRPLRRTFASHVRHGLLALAAAGPALGHAQPAFACGALPCAQLNDIQPPEGTAGVALNTEIRLLYFGSLDAASEDPSCTTSLASLRLLPEMGGPIELTGALLERPAAAEGWVVAKPAAPLAANTDYAIQLELGAGSDICRCDEREWVTVSTFTTGAEADEQPPTFGGITALRYGARSQGSSDCGETNGFPAIPEPSALVDAFPAPRYNIYVDGEIARRYVESLGTDAASTELFVDCGTSNLSTWALLDPGASIEVRGVDLSGNESAPHPPITVDMTCGSAGPGNGGAGGGSPVAAAEGGGGSGTDAAPVGRAGSAGTSASAASAGAASSTSTSGCALSHRFASQRFGAASGVTPWALFLLFWGLGRSRSRRPQVPVTSLRGRRGFDS